MTGPLPHEYMVVDDLPPAVQQLAHRLDAPIEGENAMDEATDRLSRSINQSLQTVFPSTYFISTKDMSVATDRHLAPLLELHPNVSVISLDKYLPYGTNATVHRLAMTRLANGERAPRQGSSGSMEEQLQVLDQTVGTGETLIVDDCLASGKTLSHFLSQTRPSTGAAWRESVRGIVVGEGPTDRTDFEGIPLRVGYSFPNLKDGVVTADVTPFGGRTVRVSPDRTEAFAAPYIAPFSDGRFCSLHTLENPEFFHLNLQILQAQDVFFAQMEQGIGRPITVNDWRSAGFPIPHTIDPELTALTSNPQTPMRSVIVAARNTLQNHRAMAGTMENTVIDFDNTFYAYKGSNRYTGSIVSQQHDRGVEALTLAHLPQEQATELMREALVDPLTSMVLARRLNVTRKECLDAVWGQIDPAECCDIIEGNMAALEQMRRGTKGQMMILTSAPNIWFQKALSHIQGNKALFDSIVTCEDFRTKPEFFEGLRNTLVGNTLAVGDDAASDVIPAQQRGMHGMVVDNRVRSLSYVARLFP